MKRFIYFLILLVFAFSSCEQDEIIDPTSNQEEELIGTSLESKQKDKLGKVTLCHKGKTITVNGNALNAHLAHGDKRGPCGYTYVPDDAFEQYLIDLEYDDVLDDYVLTSNISSVEQINILGPDYPVADLTGIEDFVSLTSIQLTGVTITSWIVNSTNLRSISLIGSQINTLDVSNNEDLIDISFYTTVIDNFNLSNNPNYSSFGLFDSAIREVTNISNNQNLETIWTNNSDVNILYVSENENLTSIAFDPYGGVTSLYVSDSPSLLSLSIFGLGLSMGKLSMLDISLNNINLTTLIIHNNLINSLDVSNNPALTTMNVTGNPLTCIKVNQDQLDNIPVGWVKDVEDVYSLTCE